MSFASRLQVIQQLLSDDPAKCIATISQKSFVNNLFYQELKAFTAMFQTALQKRGVQLKNANQNRNMLRSQIVIVFYSIIIMKASLVSIRQEHMSIIATRVDQVTHHIYNPKLANQTLTALMNELQPNDMTRGVIAGLLLKVKGFSNYNLVAKDLHPQYISNETMDFHFQAMKNQCPNILEAQLQKYKKVWYKYLKYKPISLNKLDQMITRSQSLHKAEARIEWQSFFQTFENQIEYLLNRLHMVEESTEIQIINIDELTTYLDKFLTFFLSKLNETALVNTKKGGKSDSLAPQFDYKHFVHRNFIKMYGDILSLINGLTTSLGISWMRKMKWLYNTIINHYVGFSIKSTNFHESVANQYSRVVSILLQIVTSYLIIFKNGLFPLGKLQQIAIDEQFSFYKLIEALLYNQYPFYESQVISFQNYQKQKKTVDQKGKQNVIDIVNFNMKSLNINPHWDSVFIKIIPNLKNSIIFAKKIVNAALFFFIQYFEITQQFQGAAKFILMLNNAKNTIFISDKQNKYLIDRIKMMVYPSKTEAKEGIQYFCEEYFSEYVKIHQQKLAQENQLLKASRQEGVAANQIAQVETNRTIIKKTESRDAIIEGWDNFESVKDSSISDMKNSKAVMLRSGQVVGNQVFYSVKQSDRQAREKAQSQIQIEKGAQQEQNEILLPEF